MDEILDDLRAEHDDLDRLVAPLTDDQWSTATPSPGWDIADQISHLWFFDQRAVMALTDPDAFAADAQRLLARGGTGLSVAPGRAVAPAVLLASWRADRAGLLELARTVDPSSRVPWYGPA